MKRRDFLMATAASLAALRERIEAAAPPDTKNIRWAVSMFLWTSTQWTETAHNFTDMLDVIKDTGFEGLRLTGWPKSLETYGMPVARLEKELSKRDLHIATLSFGGPADDPSQHAAIEKRAHEACKLLKDFGATGDGRLFAAPSQQGVDASQDVHRLRFLEPARRSLRRLRHPRRPAQSLTRPTRREPGRSRAHAQSHRPEALPLVA